jgi:hypothetical protein
MKKMLLAALLCGAIGTSQAGQLQGVTLSGAPSITVLGGYTQTNPLQYTMRITNGSGRTLRLGMQRQIRSEVAGSENNFCFGINCYPSNVSVSPANSPIVVANGAFDESAILDYNPNNRPGITVIRYAVFEQGTQDSAYITVRFDASRAVLATAASRAPESVLSQPWPNPATAGTPAELRFALPSGTHSATLQLISLADGRRVRQVALQASPAAFGAAGIAAGGCVAGGCYVFTGPVGTESRVVVATEGLAPGYYSCLLVDSRGQFLAARRLLVQ